jgi:FKBP-type peptidyl-prolyl cis-trans isomerase FklB
MKASVANTKSGYAFLDENQRKPGVIKLKSGLQYKVIKAGSGIKPTDKDVIKCHYRGTLIDGTVFEQSDPAKPASIQVEPLVPGLKEAIKLMPVGSKWEVYIPAELGFGSAGKPPKVGPDAVIIYELELLGLVSSTSVK